MCRSQRVRLCSDPDVLGAPFYVMSRVDGVVLDSADRLRSSSPSDAPASLRAARRHPRRAARRRPRRGRARRLRPARRVPRRQVNRWDEAVGGVADARLPALDEVRDASSTLPPAPRRSCTATTGSTTRCSARRRRADRRRPRLGDVDPRRPARPTSDRAASTGSEAERPRERLTAARIVAPATATEGFPTAPRSIGVYATQSRPRPRRPADWYQCPSRSSSSPSSARASPHERGSAPWSARASTTPSVWLLR